METGSALICVILITRGDSDVGIQFLAVFKEKLLLKLMFTKVV